MNNQEIRKKIDENNQKLAKVFTPNSFILNNLADDIIKENERLQQQCQHEFRDGFCIYCDITEDK